MYLAPKKLCSGSAMFDVPHQAEPMSARDIIKQFPTFAKEMDGTYDANSLSHFYKRNKTTQVYEFLDEEAEDEVAELMGVELYDEAAAAAAAAAEEAQRQVEALSDEAQFREHIADIREKLAAVDQDNTDRVREALMRDCERIMAAYEEYPASVHLANAKYVHEQLASGDEALLNKWLDSMRTNGFYMKQQKHHVVTTLDISVHGPDDEFYFADGAAADRRGST